VQEYTDRISGAKARRPGLDQMLKDARARQFDVVLVRAGDRIARSVRHFLEVLDERNHLGIEFVSFRENIDTGGPLGRAIIVIIGTIAELERSLIIERVRAAPSWKDAASAAPRSTSTARPSSATVAAA
jgi:DNA invertase Pin-like site-specific DNA recombinase